MKNDKIDILLTFVGLVGSLVMVVLLLLFALSKNQSYAFIYGALFCIIIVNVSNVVRRSRLKKKQNKKD